MGVSKLPLLSSDYPLFDWADWPDSRAALVPGGATRNFQKACWNAIVDALSDGLDAAGIPFYKTDEGLTPDQLKMLTGVYGTLTAWKFNTLREAIDDVIPFWWIWTLDANFRGYIFGTNMLRGYTVYPEYIIELVRRINLLLELLRGTAPVTDIDTQFSFASTVSPGLRVGKSAHCGRTFSSYSQTNFYARLGISAPIFHDVVQMYSKTDLQLRAVKSMPIFSWVDILLSVQPRGAVLPSFPVKPRNTFSRTYQLIDLSSGVITIVSAHPVITHSSQAAEIDQGTSSVIEGTACIKSGTAVMIVQDLPMTVPKVRTAIASICRGLAQRAQAQWISTRMMITSKATSSAGIAQTLAGRCIADLGSQIMIQMDAKMAVQGSASHLAASAQTVEALKLQSQPIEAEHTAALTAQITYVKKKSLPGWVEKLSSSQAAAEVEQAQPMNIEAQTCSASMCVCSLGTAWEPPIWKDGGLWIRQVKRWKIKPDGSLDLSGSGDPIAAVHSGMTVITCALDTLWLPPVWHEGGLLIRQVREVKVLEDGSLDLSGAGEEFKSRQNSATTVSCALDTAWLPPVMVNGGLYIRQAQEAVQNENGELEVR